MDKKYDIVSIGEILIDMTQIEQNNLGNPLFAAYSGGAPANVAVAASRLGASTAFIGKIGNDLLGHSLRMALVNNGVEDSGLSVDPSAPTPIALAVMGENGERKYNFLCSSGADIRLSVDDLPDGMIEQAKILHFGSVSMTEEPSKSATLEAIERAERSGALLSFDPNYRAPLWPDEASAVELIRSLIPHCDILKLSSEEMTLFTSTANYAQGSAQLAEMGPFLVMVTLGEDGVFYRMGGLTGHVPAQKVEAADKGGAGAAFIGTVLSQLCRLDDPRMVGQKTLEEILELANKAAGITATRPGAIPAMPLMEEIIRF